MNRYKSLIKRDNTIILFTSLKNNNRYWSIKWLTEMNKKLTEMEHYKKIIVLQRSELSKLWIEKYKKIFDDDIIYHEFDEIDDIYISNEIYEKINETVLIESERLNLSISSCKLHIIESYLITMKTLRMFNPAYILYYGKMQEIYDKLFYVNYKKIE